MNSLRKWFYRPKGFEEALDASTTGRSELRCQAALSRRAFNVSVAVSLRLGPPEPHGQVARPRVIDEFVRDEERSALSVYLSRHFLPLCSQAATVQPSQTAQGELSAFDTSYTRSQSTAEGDKPVLGLESGHLAAKNSATVIGRLCA
ncbi:hypothetical protein HPB47_008988 [Ixodes persulcatus]|uniref:Uncharacterized protein n=1 Tax=Ixodes persulcatus TaxID=34615 RepID=A0AC60P359_IXOPE|nr:hypothetical protein HPB47_008988 [Ixodes persulcatus]